MAEGGGVNGRWDKMYWVMSFPAAMMLPGEMWQCAGGEEIEGNMERLTGRLRKHRQPEKERKFHSETKKGDQ